MSSNNQSPAPRLMLITLKKLRENLQRTIAEDIRPRLQDQRVSADTKTKLQEKLEDLEKSVQEICFLERRLERL